MAKEKRFCQGCGALFEGFMNARFCSVCRVKRKKENIAKWAKNNREKRLKKLKQLEERRRKYKETANLYKKLPTFENSIELLCEEKKYCLAYNAQYIDCIKCYENQIAIYKSCYKKFKED